MRDNPWIYDAGFDESEFIIKQLLTNEQRMDIISILEYLTAFGKEGLVKHEVNNIKIDDIIKRLKTI